jgi:predicted RNase H-like HicB family nuclease
MSQKALAAAIRSSQPRVAKIEPASPDVSLDLMLRGFFAVGGRLSQDLSPTKPGRPAPPIEVEVTVRLSALALPEPGEGDSIVVPALPGCVSEAADLDDVRAQVVEAAEGWLAVAHDRAAAEEVRLARGQDAPG